MASPFENVRTTDYPIKRLLILRLSAMGDVIHTLPAVAALRMALPHTRIGWVVEERWAELLCAPGAMRCGECSPERPLVDHVHLVNTRAWRRAMFSDATWKEVLASLREIRAQSYDVALDFQGAIRSAWIARLSRARAIYGFARPREHAATLFYTRQIETHKPHVVEQNLELASAVVGQPLACARAEFPRNEIAAQQWRTTAARRHISEYAIVNPGAGWGAKQWPPDRYGEVCRLLAEKAGVQSLINYGPGEEALTWKVQKASGGAAHPITCSISELIAMTSGARLFVGGDTGPLHLAAAMGVPIVAIFGPTDPARNGPFDTRSVVLRSPASQTSHSRRKQPDAAMLQITTGDVMAAALRLLKEPRG
jgi:heptosyltransferase-1